MSRNNGKTEAKNAAALKMNRINHLTEEIDQLYHIAAFKLKLSDSALAILYTLRVEGGECSITDICFTTGISKQTINSALRKLEREEIIILKAIDAKKKTVLLTQKGKALAEETADRLIKAENSAISGWSEEEVKEYLRLLQKFLTSFKKEVDNI